MKRYVLNVLIGIDQLLTTLFGGWPDETISSYLYRLYLQDKLAGRWLMPVVDWLFRPSGQNHCESAFMLEKTRRQMPPELR